MVRAREPDVRSWCSVRCIAVRHRDMAGLLASPARAGLHKKYQYHSLPALVTAILYYTILCKLY